MFYRQGEVWRASKVEPFPFFFWAHAYHDLQHNWLRQIFAFQDGLSGIGDKNSAQSKAPHFKRSGCEVVFGHSVCCNFTNARESAARCQIHVSLRSNCCSSWVISGKRESANMRRNSKCEPINVLLNAFSYIDMCQSRKLGYWWKTNQEFNAPNFTFSPQLAGSQPSLFWSNNGYLISNLVILLYDRAYNMQLFKNMSLSLNSIFNKYQWT